MCESSEAILLANNVRKDTSPDTLALDVEASYELGYYFWETAEYAAARECVEPYTPGKLTRQVDCILGFSYLVVKMSNLLAVIDISERQFGAALTGLQLVEPHVKACDDLILTGHYNTQLGIIRQELRQYDASASHLGRALEAYKRAGAIHYAGDIENNLAMTRIRQGEPEQAERHITRAIQFCDDPLTMSVILDTRARQALSRGRFDEARMLIAEAVAMARHLPNADRILAEFAKTFGDINEAEALTKVRTVRNLIAKR